MAKIRDPRDIFPDIISDYKSIYGEDLVSIILYGSAAGGDYTPGKSDLNLLIILSEKAIDHLDSAMETVSRWRGKNVAVPLFMTRAYIDSSLDSYPLEFLNMRRTYIHVYGDDVLKDMSFSPNHVRLQCEREIKGKLLLLREGFLQTEGNKKRMRELISASITAFTSIFSGILHLRGVVIPDRKRSVVQAVAEEIPIDGNIFIKCIDIKEGKEDYSSAEMKETFKIYLKEVRKLWEYVDKMDIETLIK
ncbi:MAG: nucleotidyltransferase domain-containing protein [Deltaproteobacteria bacterium]|nr:nucleotidyltransferase domain-containing protein [Deltaproteobacteria bacterium]